MSGVYSLVTAAWEAAIDLDAYLRGEVPELAPEAREILRAPRPSPGHHRHPAADLYLTDEAAARAAGHLAAYLPAGGSPSSMAAARWAASAADPPATAASPAARAQASPPVSAAVSLATRPQAAPSPTTAATPPTTAAAPPAVYTGEDQQIVLWLRTRKAVAAQDRYAGPWNRPTASTMLVLGNTGDPVLPYQDSVAMSRDLAHARLLTVDGYGHTEAANPSTCATNDEIRYLLTGALPRHEPSGAERFPGFPADPGMGCAAPAGRMRAHGAPNVVDHPALAQHVFQASPEIAHSAKGAAAV